MKHHNPFKCTLITHNNEENLPILTADPLLRNYSVTLIWYGIQSIVDEPATHDLPSIPISSCFLLFTPQAIRGVLCVMPNRPRASSKIIPPWPLTRDSR